jgi:sugar lactone lactonase YvrE
MMIAPDRRQKLICRRVDSRFDSAQSVHDKFMGGTLPNGLAFDAAGNILISNFGTDVLEVMDREGRTQTVFDSVDGAPIGKVNFVLRDRQQRIWVTVSTRVNPWVSAMRPGLADGYILLVERGKPRIVASDIAFANELRLDANEEWLYVVETTGRHVSRFRIKNDGSLTSRAIFGPSDLKPGFPDGCTFDSYGNLWVAMVMSDRLIAITPKGEVLELLDDGDFNATADLESSYLKGTLTTEVMARAHGTIAPWLASITFGGSDLKTVYLGSLMGTTIPCFRSPVAGLALSHWG